MRTQVLAASGLYSVLAFALGVGLEWRPLEAKEELQFERVVIDDNFPGAYQVEVADVNADGKPDLVVVGGGTCAWYENPAWTKRVITGPDHSPDVISSVTADLHRTGMPAVVIGHDFAMEKPIRGKVLVADPVKDSHGRWETSSLGEFPSVHRLRAGDFDGDGKQELVIAPIFGPTCHPPVDTAEPAEVMIGTLEKEPGKGFLKTRIGSDQVLHAIDVLDLDGDGRDDLLTAGNSGVIWHHRESQGSWQHQSLVAGSSGLAPNKGASEVHVGKLGAGARFLATIEPWHGTEVVVYESVGTAVASFGSRRVVDDTLDVGHALWVADVDGDGVDEVFAGHRGKDPRVSVYRFDGRQWTRTVIDRQTTAQDLRGGDLDGDGRPDIVAVGGASHNVVWYRPVNDR